MGLLRSGAHDAARHAIAQVRSRQERSHRAASPAAHGRAGKGQTLGVLMVLLGLRLVVGGRAAQRGGEGRAASCWASVAVVVVGVDPPATTTLRAQRGSKMARLSVGGVHMLLLLLLLGLRRVALHPPI